MHIAIQGDQASFHELAATLYYSSRRLPITYLYCQTFEEVFAALDSGQVDRGFVAISNSSHGPIDEVAQLMTRYQPLIEAEYRYDVHQHLIGVKGARLADIQTVTSHPVALSQCSDFLQTYKNVEPYHDTAAAIKQVQLKADPSLAAVGSWAAAELYGLTILQENIHNDPDNHTVFAALRVA